MHAYRTITPRAFGFCLLLTLGCAHAQALPKPELVYTWTRMEWVFPDAAARRTYETGTVYEKATLAGIAVDKAGSIYVTTLRWLDARVPASLNKIVIADGKPLLQPFPNLAANDVAKPAAFQSVLGIKIDTRNRLWTLDMGNVAGRKKTPDGAQKLVIIDLNTGAELRRYVIPDAIANRDTSFLNDIAIDELNDVAYLSDSGMRDGKRTAAGIIVYDYKANTARRVLDSDPSVQNDVAHPLVVDGDPVLPGNPLPIGINGVALSPDGARLYWNITAGDALYSVPTAILRDRSKKPKEIAAAISPPVRIGGGSDGIAMDSKGRVWLTNLTLNRIQLLDPKTGRLTTVSESRDHVWPDSFAWDNQGHLFFTSNHLNHAFGGVMKFDGAPNFRIWRLQTDAQRSSTLAPVN